MKVWGLTGGIASGKSTVAKLLRDEGIPVIDADEVSRTLTTQGSPALKSIVEVFGSACLTEKGDLDRRALRHKISGDKDARRMLEGIIHPAIRQEIQEWVQRQEQAGVSLAVVEAALLVETGSYKNYDGLIVVECEPTLQIERLMARDKETRAQGERMVNTQASAQERRNVASILIPNSGDLEALESAVGSALSRINAP